MWTYLLWFAIVLCAATTTMAHLEGGETWWMYLDRTPLCLHGQTNLIKLESLAKFDRVNRDYHFKLRQASLIKPLKFDETRCSLLYIT